MKRKKRLVLLGKFAVSAVLVWLLYRHIPLADIRTRLSGIDARPLPLVLGLLLLNTLLSSWKWQVILRADEIHVPLRSLFVSYIIGTFLNIFLPSNIGGDAYRIYDIGRVSAQPARSFASVLADRLSGFLALVLLALAASILVIQRTGNLLVLFLPVAVLTVLVFGVWTLYHPPFVRSLMRLLKLNRLGAVTRFADSCMGSFSAYGRNARVVWKIMAISFIFQFSVILCVFLLAGCLDIHAPFRYFCTFVPLITLMEALPISIYGVGVRDVGYVFFFAMAGLSEIQTRSLAVLYLAVNIAYSLIGGLVLLVKTVSPAAAGGQPPRARGPKRAVLALAVVLVVWAVFSWPLPRYLGSGIPASAANVEKGAAREMIPGDHLQLMYHFWLAGDMMRGRTRLFHNVYEFNTGDDAERVEPGAYYAPFSLVYAVISWVGGRALGWNLAGLLSLFLTYLMTWLLTRRYVSDDGVTAVASLFGILLPYRWITLLGGSPTGFAMALVPVLFLGLDVAVREEKKWGSVLAGAALLCSYCSDLHVFFFGALATPCWCLLALAARPPEQRWRVRTCTRIAWALWPFLVFCAAALLLSRMTAAELGTASMARGWSLREVAPYAPFARGLFAHARMGVTNQVYLGVSFVVLLAAGGLALTTSPGGRRGEAFARLTVMVLLVAGMIAVVTLALGPHGPLDGLVLKACRKVIPPYRMVRQTAKVFCLMPTLLALAATLSLAALVKASDRRWWRLICLAAFALLPLAEYGSRIQATVCVLENRQEAYAAVAEDARGRNREARVLVVTLWPGNSHWTSTCQHDVSLYRIRMINGYRPAVQQAYIENVFRRFESLNQGVLTDGQLDALAAAGVAYVMLHEDSFPEQVSPFPVGLTLRRLLTHPRLELLTQHEHVWAFRVLAAPRTQPDPGPSWPFLFPARRWEAERLRATGVAPVDDATASGGSGVRMDSDGAELTVRPRARIANAPDLRWLMRTRGHGTITCTVTVDGGSVLREDRRIESDTWSWTTAQIPTPDVFFDAALDIAWKEGAVDLDLCLLAAGPWASPSPGASIDLPAPCFFHAGYTELETDRVLFRKRREPDREIFYGPMMPLDAGDYRVTLLLDTDAPAGTELGVLTTRAGGNDLAGKRLRAGEPAVLTFAHPSNLPLRIDFAYSRNADLAISRVTLSRLR